MKINNIISKKKKLLPLDSENIYDFSNVFILARMTNYRSVKYLLNMTTTIIIYILCSTLQVF